MIAIFISRHSPTVEQVALAIEAGYRLLHVGDVDAFNTGAVTALFDVHPNAAVCCEHPAIAMTAVLAGRTVLVFESRNYATVGEPPRLGVVSLWEWDCCPASLHERPKRSFHPPVITSRGVQRRVKVSLPYHKA